MRFLLPLLLLLVPFTANAELQISGAWIKNLPPSVPMRAGYMSIHNASNAEVTIVGASSERFAKVEIHQTVAEDGVMKMRPIKDLVVAPGGSIELSPGGYHLMLMKPVEPTKPGETINIKIRMSDGSEQSLSMQVKK